MNFKLLEAAKEGNLATLKQLLQCPRADVNIQEKPICTESTEEGKGCGRTPLYWSIQHNNLPMVKFLLEQPNINGSEYGKAEDWTSQWTPLMLASFRGYADIVKLMLTYPNFKRLINQREIPHFYTPLMEAALSGQQNMNETMLELLKVPSINVNAKTKYGSTILHYAAQNGRVEIVSILLHCNKTNITIKDDLNETALETAKIRKEDASEEEDIKIYDDIIKLMESRAVGEILPGDPTC